MIKFNSESKRTFPIEYRKWIRGSRKLVLLDWTISVFLFGIKCHDSKMRVSKQPFFLACESHELDQKLHSVKTLQGMVLLFPKMQRTALNL